MRASAAQVRATTGQLQVITAFRSAGALSGASARRLRDIGLNDSVTLRGMVTSEVIRRAGPERYFLDETAWAKRRQLRWRTLLRIGLVVALAIGALLISRL